MKNLSIGVAVITYKAKHLLPNCLPPLLASSLKPQVLVVNSSSNDGTVELAQQMGAETLVIKRDEFNHGATREFARKYLGTDIVVMITPDAYPTDDKMVERLVAPIQRGEASIAYARQIPHDGAKFFEAFPREYNYPAKSHIRSIKESGQYGVYTFFCSDSCAAWRNSALDEIGGFETVLSLEDGIATAKLLRRGHKIAYVAEAVVKHSHRYNLKQEFQRYFDTGYERSRQGNLFFMESTDEKRGVGFVYTMSKRILKEQPWMLPYGLVNAVVKYAGYWVGSHSRRLPPQWVRKLSGQDFYWESKFFKGAPPQNQLTKSPEL
jgi:rhamnosyltransferase